MKEFFIICLVEPVIVSGKVVRGSIRWIILGCLLPALVEASGTNGLLASMPGIRIESPDKIRNSVEKQRQYRFKNITVRDGLSFYRVRVVVQDRYGFIWLGADNGMDRFDGKSITSFRHNPSDTNSISQNEVSCFLSDPEQDRIWIGTRGGLCFIHVKTFQVTRIDLGPFDDIRAIAEDHEQGLWLGTMNGLLHLNDSTFEYKVYQTSNSGLSHNQVRSIYRDLSGNLWVGTQDKLNQMERGSGAFITYDLRGNHRHPIQNNLVLDICPFAQCSDTLLWIGTETGLCLFNRYTGVYKIYRKNGPGNLSNDKVAVIHRADSLSLWLGTDFGLNLFDIKNETSEHFYHDPASPGSLSNNKIWSIYADRSGVFWFASDNGVNLLDNNQKAFNFYPVSDQLSGHPVGIQINDIIPDQSGGFWLATQQGILRFSISGGITTTFRHQPGDPHSLLAAKTLDLYTDEFERLWIATNKGINVWDTGRGRMYSFPANFGPGAGLKSQFTNSLIRANDGSLWVGTWDGGLHRANGYLEDMNSIDFVQVNTLSTSQFISGPKALWILANGGLYRMDLLTNQVARIEAFDEAKEETSFMYSIIYSCQGVLWIGTRNGLIEYTIHKDQVRFHPIQSGRDYDIIGLLEDDNGDIWSCTVTSILKFGKADRQFEIYPIGNEIPLQGFMPGSQCKSGTGDLVFAGQDGMIIFDPDQITKSDYQPDIVISELYIQNERVIPGKEINGKFILDYSVSFEKEITLSYIQRSLQFNFASLHYGDPSGNIFAYRLEGFEDDWVYTSGNRNFAIYSNLPSGKYRFRLRGTNNDGVWNKQERSLLIRIKPPPWASPLSVIIYIFVFILLLTLIIYIYQMKVKWLDKLQKIRTEKEQTDELAMLKQRFFTNVSHEFRTPLNLILGPTSELLKKDALVGENRKLLELIFKNGQRLLRLVNQLIDFRKLEISRPKLMLSRNEIVGFCQKICDLFSDRAERKKINFSFRSNRDAFESWFDPVKMETVLYNLLSNAFNFTPDGGEISIEVIVQSDGEDHFPEGTIHIRVKDTGIGIPVHDQSKIFERFYQSEQGLSMSKGSGIGLTLVKEYVEMHNGDISVESSEGTGSVFHLKIPIKGIEPLPEIPGEFQKDSEEMLTVVHDSTDIYENPEQYAYLDHPMILIVEDDPEVIDFIRISLGEKYGFMLADTGKAALRQIEMKLPDLIISDVIMPEMDGYALCSAVKGKPKTSHIPVILVSARTSNDHQIEGIRSGADAYLNKPFDIKYLDALIENLLHRQELLAEHARLETILNPAELVVSSTEEKILKQVITYIESHISDPELSVANICQATGFTHSFLYRKIKHITGGTLNELIKDIRIKRAAQLLKTGKLNVAEVMVEVGFSNHSYFSKCFRRVYRKSPGDYIHSHVH